MSIESHSPEQQRKILFGFAAATLVVCFWSGFNIVSRLGGRSELTPYDIAALRFGVSGILLSPFYFWGRHAITWLQTLILTIFGGLGYGLLVYCGFAHAPAAHAGVLVNGGIPFATVLISCLALGYRPGRQALLSLLLAAAGIESAREEGRGYDHGTFVPLMLAFPEATLPVAQLSLLRAWTRRHTTRWAPPSRACATRAR